MNELKPDGPSGNSPALVTMGMHTVVGMSVFPSPLPSPPTRCDGAACRDDARARRAARRGRGRSMSCGGASPCASDLPLRSRSFSLSSGERVGVRGNGATLTSKPEPSPRTVKLDESPGKAGAEVWTFPLRYPKGISPQSPELRGKSYPGKLSAHVTTPRGLRLKNIVQRHSPWCLRRSVGSQPRWGCEVVRAITQGSFPLCGTTLGFGMESRWDSKLDAWSNRFRSSAIFEKCPNSSPGKAGGFPGRMRDEAANS